MQGPRRRPLYDRRRKDAVVSPLRADGEPPMVPFGGEELLEPVTNQVTTAPGNGRRSPTHPDITMPLNCGNQTQRDAIGRNRDAW